MHPILDDLKWRGLYAQDSDPEGLRALLASGPQTLYCGFDPTASSLHIGNLVPLLCLRRFQLAGHVPIVLMGGATGMIGDPSGKSAERNLNEKATIDAWLGNIRGQVARFVDLEAGRGHLVDNYSWTSELSTIDFLRDIGKHFSVTAMLAKDSVRSRIEREDGGISYTEFSYMVLQALDFYELAKSHGCRLQIGGNDQWGNITAGIDLCRRKLGLECYGLTFPLITTAAGTKFGKTERGTVWLDAERTPPYAYYQFWINTDDRDVGRFLRFFTFLEREEIEALEAATAEKPEERQAQKRLAAELTTMTHGAAELDRVLAATHALFGGGDLASVDQKTLTSALDSAPGAELAGLDEAPMLPGLLVAAGIVTSNSEARRVIGEGGAYVNNTRITDPRFRPTAEHFLHGQFLVLRRGKKSYGVVRLTGTHPS